MTIAIKSLGAVSVVLALFAAPAGATTGQARAVMAVTATVVPSCHASTDRIACSGNASVSVSHAAPAKPLQGMKAEAGTRYLTISY